jgi:hypothetical protein
VSEVQSLRSSDLIDLAFAEGIYGRTSWHERMWEQMVTPELKLRLIERDQGPSVPFEDTPNDLSASHQALPLKDPQHRLIPPL